MNRAQFADEEWEPTPPDFKAEMAANKAWTLFDQAMDALTLAINLSNLPEYLDTEPEHVRAAWRKLMKAQANIGHELNEAGWSFSRLRLEIPIEKLEESK